MKNISKKLKDYRVKNNLSQEEVSYMIGVEQTEVSKIERGAKMPSSAVLERLIGLIKGNIDK